MNMQSAIQALQTIAQALNKQVQATQAVFPQQTGTATTAVGGSAVLPSAPVGFIVVSLPNGTSVKVPYYAG